MDYVALLRFRPHLSAAERDSALMRRASYQYPAGAKVIAEYWPAASSVNVVSIFTADDFSTVLELILEWGDVFEIDVHPAVSAEEGLSMGLEVVGRVPRLRQG